MPDKRFIYKGDKFSDPGINTVCYTPGFFQIELDLESDVFYELRRMNGIEPVRINQSSPKELDEIKDLFAKNKGSFHFLFHESGELIGSTLHIRNYIQSLSISRKYQSQGYGERLSTYCINKILDKGYTCVELNVLQGNIKAERLYKKLGFVEIK